MVPLYTPETLSEEAVISSLLTAYEIPFFIRGGGFGKLYPGVQIRAFNTRTFMVDEDKLELAQELIKDFLSDTDTPPAPSSDKFRVLLEFLLAGWGVPGKRPRDKE